MASQARTTPRSRHAAIEETAPVPRVPVAAPAPAPRLRLTRFVTATTDRLRPRGRPPQASKPPADDKHRIAFIDVGRALAALLVVYSHIDWVFLSDRKLTFGPFAWLDRWLFVPLGFGAQGPGGISVPVFFLVSGFVVTPIAMRMGAARFAVNRLFRVFPLLLFALAVSLLVVALGEQPLITGHPEPITVSKVLSNALLYNFLSKPLDAYVAVAWTLVIECIFYLLLIALSGLLRRSPILALLVQFDLIIGVFLTHDWFGAGYSALAANFAYLLIPVLGQVLWATWHKHIPAWAGGALLVFGWLLFRWAGRADFDQDYVLRPYPVAMAVVVVVIGVFAERHLRERKFWVALSERSYSIYLLHGAVAFPVLDLLHTQLPLGLAILLALLSAAVVVELSYRLVERPSHRLARRLSRLNWRAVVRRAGASARPAR